MNGYIKLWRKFNEWQWIRDPNMVSLFMHLLLNARVDDVEDGEELVRRGELKTTLPALSENTGLTISQVRTCIEKLRMTGEIAVRIAVKYRVITVCKFEDYQDKRSGSSQSKSQTKSQTEKEKEKSPNNIIYNNPLKEQRKNSNLNEEEEGKETTPINVSSKESQSLSLTTQKTEKQKELETRRERFYQALVPYVKKYGPEMIRSFYDYWSEANKSYTKMRYEQQPTWELGKRLSKWFANNYESNAKPKQTNSTDIKW